MLRWTVERRASLKCRLNMKDSTIGERFERFVAKPTSRRYLALRRHVMADGEFDPLSEELRLLQSLLDQADYAAVQQTGAELWPRWLLSPRFHFLLGIAALQSGEARLANHHKASTHACLQGLLATGDGTPQRPFRITYPPDEHDVARCLDFSIRSQEVVDLGTHICDVVTSHEGNELWFDATHCVRRASQGAFSRVGALA